MTDMHHPDHYNLYLRGLDHHHHLGSCFITQQSPNMIHPSIITEMESKAVYSHEVHAQTF